MENNRQQFLVDSVDADVVYTENPKKSPFTVAVLSSAANSAKDVGSAAMKAGTASVMVLSLASAVALIKIF